MMRTVETDPKSLILVIADMARSNPPIGEPFVAELARRLHGQSPALALPLTWIEQRLAEVGLDDSTSGAGREPAAGRGPGLGEQLDRQPALARRDRLAQLRRIAGS
jgi:hypothetical protein